MSPETESLRQEMLEQISRAIADAVAPEYVYVFGSRARGTASPHSDIDLLVVERAPFGRGHNRLEELLRIRRAISGVALAKDILVFSLDEVHKWRDSLNHIIGDCLREGILLYARH